MVFAEDSDSNTTRMVVFIYVVGEKGNGKMALRSAVPENSPRADGIANVHGVLRLRSAAPRFAQDDSGEVFAEMLAEA
jgi:hypothetical protein